MIVDRDGQHSGVVATPLGNSAPPSTNASRVFGITPSVSERWSSVRTISTLGGRSGLGDPVDAADAGKLGLDEGAGGLTVPVHAARRTRIGGTLDVHNRARDRRVGRRDTGRVMAAHSPPARAGSATHSGVGSASRSGRPKAGLADVEGLGEEQGLVAGNPEHAEGDLRAA